MTINEKRRAVVYIAGQIKSYKEYKELDERCEANTHYNKARGAVEMLALALQDDEIVYKLMYNMKMELMQKELVPIERIHWYADRLE